MTNPYGGSFGDPGQSPFDSGGGINAAAVSNATINRAATVTLNANTGPYQQQMGAAAAATNQVTGAVTGLLSKVDQLSKRAANKVELIGKADIATLIGATASAGQLQAQMATLSATAAVNRTSMTGYSRAVDATFNKFPQHRGEVVALVTELTNLGTKQSDVASVASSVTKLGEASGENIPQLAQDLIQLNRQMGNDNAQKIAGYSNSVLTVSKNAGVSVTSVLQFGQAIAPISRQAGIGEAAVLGISTAFSKAGADGFVAANTFNSIVNDITTLTKTGSPELVKYANFVGKTADAFRKLPAKTQITEIFDAIAKGGPQALNFVQELGLGTRALSAVQAVAQSGGLGQYIHNAEANAGNTHNLDRGAAAATAGLDSATAMLRNQVTRFVDILGAPFLGVATGFIHGMTDIVKVINAVVSHLGPLPAIIGGVVGVMAPVLGFLLGHAGLVAGLAGVKLLTSRTGPGRAFSEGRQVGAMPTGYYGTREQELSATETGRRMAEGSMPFRGRGAYYAGRFWGDHFGAGSSAPGGFATGVRRVAAGSVLGAGAAGRWYFDSQSRALNDARLGDYQRSAYLTGGSPTARARIAAFGERVGGAAESNAALGKAIGGEVARGIGSAGGFLGNTARTGLSFLGPLGRGLGAVGRAAFSLPGALALGIGIPLVSNVVSSYNQRYDQSRNLTNDLDPIKRYNDALGIATTHLADFSTQVGQAAKSVAGKQSTATTFATAGAVTPTDISKFYNKGSSDPTITALAAHGKGNVAQARALLGAYGITEPKQLDLFKQNLLGAGFSEQQVSQVLSGFKVGAGPNYAALGTAIASTEGHGAYSSNPSSSGNRLIGAALSSLSINRQLDTSSFNAPYASTKYLRDSLALLSSQGGALSGARNPAGIAALGATLDTLTGGKSGDYESILTHQLRPRRRGGRAGGNASGAGVDLSNMSDADRQKFLLSVLGRTKAGQDFLANIRASGGTTDFAGINAALAHAAGLPSDAQKANAAAVGPLGRFYSTDKVVQAAAVGGSTGDPQGFEQAVGRLTEKAVGATKNFGEASGALQKLADTLGGSQTTAGQLALAAVARARLEQQQNQLPYQSQAEQGKTLQGNLQASRAAALAPGASKESQALYHSDQAAWATYQQQQTQRLISIGQAADQFYVSQTRAAEDYHLQVGRSERNFQIQMVQGEQDYTRQRARTLEDFNTQMVRQAQQAAESIYNPYARVQSQQVENGGMLAGNLEDQNRRIEQQHAQVAKLRRAGLSQAAVDTLRLDDPNNAQQTNSIAQSVINDPKTIKRINALIATRQKATTALTQSQYNQDFRNTVSDFERGLNRTKQDYDTARNRAVSAQSLALSDMAHDFNTMVTRSGQDLTTQMTELYGNYASNYTKTLQKINNEIGKYAPELAQTLTTQLGAVNAAVNSIVNGGGNSPDGGGGSSAPIGSMSNPDLTPGVLGINPQGKLGSYTAGGRFVPYSGPRNSGALGSATSTHIAPGGGGSDQLYSWLYAAGWPRNSQATHIMHAIALAESGGRPSAHNYNLATGDDSYGLAQINMLGSMGPSRRQQYGLSSNDDLFNPVTNLRIAWAMSGHGSHFGDWSTYNRGDYLSHMAEGGIAIRATKRVFGEAGPEAVLPLNARGANFMAGFVDRVTQALMTRMPVIGRGIHGMGGGTSQHYYQDHRTVYSGNITVQADDPRVMERKLAERQRLKRLAMPVH